MSDNKNTAVKQAATGAKRGRKPAPENETKSQRFDRLAVERTRKALRYIAALGNLSGSAYESTEEKRERIWNALQVEIDRASAKYEKTEKQKAAGFTL